MSFYNIIMEARLLPGRQQLGGSGDCEYFTPSKYVEVARDVLGEIDLDPMSCPQANRIVRATRIFTKAEDGLRQEWHGRVWLNAPFNRMRPSVQKLLHEYKAGRTTEAIMLSISSTSTRWFQEAASGFFDLLHKYEYRFHSQDQGTDGADGNRSSIHVLRKKCGGLYGAVC
jgi:DNA N-6-adenine-methyltransferase (Dam)